MRAMSPICLHLTDYRNVLKNHSISLLFGQINTKLCFSSLDLQSQPHPDVSRDVKTKQRCHKPQAGLLLVRKEEKCIYIHSISCNFRSPFQSAGVCLHEIVKWIIYPAYFLESVVVTLLKTSQGTLTLRNPSTGSPH